MKFLREVKIQRNEIIEEIQVVKEFIRHCYEVDASYEIFKFYSTKLIQLEVKKVQLNKMLFTLGQKIELNTNERIFN